MTSVDTRRQPYPVGIEDVAIEAIERQVPNGEAPALAPNQYLAVIGKPVPRADGRAKVTSAARFTVDVQLPGMVHARLLRSPHPHARVVAIDVSAAERHPDVHAVHLITVLVGRAVESAPKVAAAGSRERRVLYVGDPIAAVAATTSDAARAALDLIKVDYRPLPFVVDFEDAQAANAARVFDESVHGESYAGGAPGGTELPRRGNVRGPNRTGSRGDVALGFTQADVIVEGEFRTQVETHCCLETHAVVADWRPDMLTVYLSTQYAAGVRNELAFAFGLPRSRVRVVVEAMGGEFGSKSSAGNYVRAAVALSRNAARQVLATLLNAATLVVGAARHASRVALTVATPLAKNAYKVPVFEALARRAIIDAGSPT